MLIMCSLNPITIPHTCPLQDHGLEETANTFKTHLICQLQDIIRIW